MKTGSQLRYMPALDGLRALAIVLVVTHHALPNFWFGRLGVDVFFVLSGFLITALIAGDIEAARFTRREFYARRAIRLIPALIVTLIVFTPIGIATGGHKTLLGAGLALAYLTPFMATTIFGHTWTLAVEEWYYLLWPVVLSRFFRDRLTLRQAAALIGSVGVLIQAAGAVRPHYLLVRPSGLMIGSALGLWWLSGGRVPRPGLSIAGGVSLIIGGVLAGPLIGESAPVWLVVSGSALAIAGIASDGRGVVRSVLELTPVVAVGVVSYEWYLLHFPMMQIGNEIAGSGTYWLTAPASLALAFGLHYAIALLQRRLRRRLEDRRDPDVGVAAIAPSAGVGAVGGRATTAATTTEIAVTAAATRD